MDHGWEGQSSAGPIDQALALAASLTGATTLLVETGATQTRWGVDDPGGHLPVLKSPLLTRDAGADAQFSNHPVITRLKVRALAAAPLQVAPGRPVLGTLWAMGPVAGAFSAAQLDALLRVASIIAGLLSPSTSSIDLGRLVASLPTPAVAVIAERLVPNAAACALTGFSGDELPTVTSWFERLYGGEGEVARELYDADRASGFLDARTVPLTRKDGWERLVQFHAAIVDEGELWFLTDITERVASQERFRLLFEQSSTPHLLLGATGIVDCNAAAVALLGYRSKADLLRLHPMHLSPELQPDGRKSTEKAAEMDAMAFEQGSHRFDWVHRTAAGAEVSVEVTLTPQILGAQRLLLVEWHDLTERLRYEEGLRQARDAAMDHARAKSDFLAVMSHEIRTPMNGVIGVTRLLLDTPLSVQQKDHVDSLRACGEGLLALLNDILDFSRLDAGKVTLEAIPLSLRDLIDETVSVVSDAAIAKGLSLVVLEGNDAPDRVVGDPTRLRQVLLNLVSNAVKFTASGGVEVRLTSTQRDERGRRVICLAVRDSGIGIAPSALPRLFSAFSQEDSSTTRRFGGSGLGLAICKRLVGLMGGVIDVVSGPHGTTFSVNLSLDEAPPLSTLGALHGRRVLLVAPPSVSRLALRQVLVAAGAGVDEADSEPQAFAAAEQAEVVLVDDEAHGAASRTLAARLVAPHRKVGVVTSPRISNIEVPPGCFRLTRPLRRRQVLDAVVQSLVMPSVVPLPRPVDERPAFAGVRVLVAEDNPINQRVVRGLLGKLGCTVCITDNGALALEALEAQSFDVVFMDCQMPVLDGFEATRALRARHGPGLPVVALTAGTMEGDRERCLQAGMTDFLAKPVRPEDLERVLAKLVPARGELEAVGT